MKTVLLLLAVPPLALAACFAARTAVGPERPATDHTEWVAKSLEEMQKVRPGATRGELLKVFVGEGGLSTGVHRTYVYRECPYMKVDVDFRAVGRPERDAEGRVTLEESEADVVVKISKPYLDWMVID